MRFDPELHHRRTIRLKGYDYAIPGAYFVTICTHHRACLFGEIIDDKMRLNDAGQMVQTVWDEIPAHYPGIDIDTFMIMPNHIHGIIKIVGAAPRGRPEPVQTNTTVGAAPCGRPEPVQTNTTVGAAPCGRPEQGSSNNAQPHEKIGQPQEKIGQPQGVAPTGLSLPDVVHRFKTMTTKRYTDGVKQKGWPAFPGKLWQRNYYERVIRDDQELSAIRQYVAGNPAQWAIDADNPSSRSFPFQAFD